MLPMLVTHFDCIKMLLPTPMGGFTLPLAKLPNCTHIVSNEPPSYTVILHTSHTIPYRPIPSHTIPHPSTPQPRIVSNKPPSYTLLPHTPSIPHQWHTITYNISNEPPSHTILSNIHTIPCHRIPQLWVFSPHPIL